MTAWLIREKGLIPPPPLDVEQIWWNVYDFPSSSITLKMISLGGQLGYALFFGWIVFRQMKRNPSAVLSFFSLFLFSFSLQIFRLFFLISPEGQEKVYGILFTKIIFFSRALGLGALFTASLFNLELQIQKFGMSLLILLLTSFTLSTRIPVNTSLLTGALINRSTNEKDLAILFLTLEILTIINYLVIAIKQGKNEFYKLALFLFLIFAGGEFLFFMHGPFVLPGFIFLFTGTGLFLKENRKLFLWS